ncbi:MAG: NAD(P)/FAD-dependent oxidoreductase [Pyrinomonadaceae bacterium]
MTRIDGTHFDVVIAGGGPAGCSTAIRLAERGIKVLIVEQKTFPREKLCGEFISPECLEHFHDLGVLEKMTLAGCVGLDRTVFYTRRGRSVEVPSEWFGSGSQALGLSRAEMDRVLLARAREVGVTVCEETSASLFPTERGQARRVRLKPTTGEPVEVRAGLTIDATGRSRVLARQIEKELGPTVQTKPEYIAFKTHLAGARVPERDCEIYAYRGGYGGASGVEHDRFNVCFIVKSVVAKQFGGDAERVMRGRMFSNERAAYSLAQATVVEPWLAVPISAYGRFDPTPADGLICVGDAAAFIDPFTGSGMLMALQCGKMAADTICDNLEHDFQTLAADYKSRHSRLFDRRLRICSLVRHAAFAPFIGESLITLLSKSRFAARSLTLATRGAR